jgi:V8-like Glu-specific endopeptidase
MNRLSRILLLTSILSAGMGMTASFADDFSAGRSVDAEASRDIGAGDFTAKPSKAPAMKRSADASSRGVLDDENALRDAYSVISRSRDGTERTIEPGSKVIEAIKGDKKAENEPAAPKGAADPAVAEASRDVIGDDNRVAVDSTTKYPYDVVGMIETVHSKSGTTYDCTASLIGPSTIITAARCVYSHDLDGGWMDKLTFWPGINGQNNVPFGSFDWANMYVFEGFIKKWDGTYDSVWPYDVAVIELAKPAGNQLGYLGYDSYPNLGDFQGNLVGYQSDKPSWTQWRSTCDVVAENITDQDFQHDCDADAWSIGAPIYAYQASDKSRRIVGLNMGAMGNVNWALRISAPILEWINSLNK